MVHNEYEVIKSTDNSVREEKNRNTACKHNTTLIVDNKGSLPLVSHVFSARYIYHSLLDTQRLKSLLHINKYNNRIKHSSKDEANANDTAKCRYPSIYSKSTYHITKRCT